MKTPGLTDATLAELDELQSLSLPSGYDCVYEKKFSWQAKIPSVFGKGTLGVFPTPRLAATAVALWMRDQFGPHWTTVYRHRHEPGWVVYPVEWRGGLEWVAKVWEDGVPAVLPPPKTRSLGFATEAEAVRAVTQYVRDKYGLFADVIVRRGGPCGFVRPT